MAAAGQLPDRGLVAGPAIAGTEDSSREAGDVQCVPRNRRESNPLTGVGQFSTWRTKGAKSCLQQFTLPPSAYAKEEPPDVA
jgi:hypothetical protein